MEWTYYVKATTTETVQRLDLTDGDSLLDVGCGSSYLLDFLRSAGFSGTVAGLDLSPNMLKQAARRLGGGTPLTAGAMKQVPSGTIASTWSSTAIRFTSSSIRKTSCGRFGGF